MVLLSIYIIISIFIAWIWVDYFRLIDIFKKDDLSHLLIVFLLGAGSTYLVLKFDDLNLSIFNLYQEGILIHDLLYCIFKIGLIEELAKAIPILLTYAFFKQRLREPIDILAFFCVSALGFSAAENVMYFNQGGPSMITGRAILASVAHMFNTALLSYGLIRIKFFHENKKLYLLIIYCLFAATSHGLYDFIIIHLQSSISFVLVIAYFFLTVSVFATILNNCINNSSFFTYSLVIDSDKVSQRLLMYYGIVYLFQLGLVWYFNDFIVAVFQNVFNVLTVGFVIIVTITRLSRFKLIKDRWNKLKIEMPFTYEQQVGYKSSTSNVLRIRGESYNEAYVNAFYNEFCLINPVSSKSSFLEESKIAFLESKLFLKNDETFYLLKVFNDFENNIYFKVLLKPKITGNRMVNNEYPIVGLLFIDETYNLQDTNLSLEDFEFLEWAYIKPRQDFDESTTI